MNRRRSYSCSLALSLLLAACGSSDGDDDGGNTSFSIRTAAPSVAATTPIVIDGKWIGILGSEAATSGGTNWNSGNGDSDTADSIVHVINTDAESVRNIRVAADPTLAPAMSLAFVNRVLFVVASEAATTRTGTTTWT